MRILLDHSVPRGLVRFLEGHTVRESKAQGWDRLTNGELLKAAEEAGFEVLVTADQRLPHQQNIAAGKMAVVVLTRAHWHSIRSQAPQIVSAILAGKPGTVTVVKIPGR